jgi:hypothetical protein
MFPVGWFLVHRGSRGASAAALVIGGWLGALADRRGSFGLGSAARGVARAAGRDWRRGERLACVHRPPAFPWLTRPSRSS